MRLLLVDDRPEDRELIVRRLRQKIEPLELTEVASAVALQAALRQGPFDLVVTDYQLRWSDGLQVLREIKAHFPDTPVVMCTDSGNEQVVAEGMCTGLSDYVLKRHLERLPTAVLYSLERAELQRKYEEAAREVQLSEQRYRTIAGRLTDLAYTLRVEADVQTTLEWVSGKLLELTGYDRAELEARGWWLAITYAEDQPVIREHLARLLTGQPAEAELRILTRQGEVRWLHIADQPELDAEGERVSRIYGGVRDVTVRRRAEELVRQARDELEVRVQERTAELKQVNESLQRQAEELQTLAEKLRQQNLLNEALNRINALLSVTFDVKAVMQEVFVQAISALGAEAGILTWQEENGWSTIDAYGLLETIGHDYTDEEVAPTVWVAQHREILVVDDLRAAPYLTGWMSRYNLGAIVSIPLLLQEQAAAVMTFGYRTKPAWFGSAQVDFARKVAASLALAIENERLHQQAQKDADARAMLLREVNHRVKNNLTAIVGLLYAQLNRTDLAGSPEYLSTILDLTRRVEGLAIAHTMLSASQWTPLALDELTRRVLGSALQAVSSGQLEVEVAPSTVHVSPDQAHTLALVINELALNVGKHALKTGAVVRISVWAALEEGAIAFVFRDSGPGYPEQVVAGQQSGVGIDLVRNLVRRSLRGQLRLRNENGAVTEIRFPHQQQESRNGQ